MKFDLSYTGWDNSPVIGKSHSFSFCFVLIFHCKYLKLEKKYSYEFLRTAIFKDLPSISM